MQRLSGVLLVSLSLITAAHLSWLLLASANFLYEQWYDLLQIEETIAYYGPRNTTRPSLQDTSKAERIQLFAGLVHGIRDAGSNLESLHYHDRSGKDLGPMLTSPEIEHLKSVSRMVRIFEQTGWLSLTGFGLLMIGMRSKQLVSPPVLKTTRRVMAGTAIATVLLLAAGPQRVFYGWHEWAFPKGQTWFFYYEDSLMTMLMKAPDIFAYISASWCILTIAVFISLLNLARWLTRAREQR